MVQYNQYILLRNTNKKILLQKSKWNYQYFMVNKCSKRLFCDSLYIWCKMFDRIKIGYVDTTLIWLLTF